MGTPDLLRPDTPNNHLHTTSRNFESGRHEQSELVHGPPSFVYQLVVLHSGVETRHTQSGMDRATWGRIFRPCCPYRQLSSIKPSALNKISVLLFASADFGSVYANSTALGLDLAAPDLQNTILLERIHMSDFCTH